MLSLQAAVGNQIGKSRLVCSFMYNEFEEVDDPTVEDSYSKDITVDGLECKLDLLDTSGNDCYSNLYNKV